MIVKQFFLLLMILIINKSLLFPSYCYGSEIIAKNIRLKLNWSYKNLIAFSKTLNGELFTHNINRVRLKAKGNIGDFFSFKVIYDNELFLGDFLSTNEFKILNNTESLVYYDPKQENINEFFRFNINANNPITDEFDIWGEYFFNGKEDKRRIGEIVNIQNFKSDISTTNSHFLGLGSTYTYDIDLNFNFSTILDLEGVSYYINPYLIYELFKNTDISAGSRLYFGGGGTEFEPLPNSYYISLEWSF